MVGEACLPSNAYYPRTPDYTLYSGVHVCWSEHSDWSFVYGFMSLDNGLCTMTATTFRVDPISEVAWCAGKQIVRHKGFLDMAENLKKRVQPLKTHDT